MSLPRGFRLFRTTMSGEKIYEGVLAVHKPQSVTSADVIRKLQSHFKPSELFRPWIEHERAERARSSSREAKFSRKRRNKNVDVKIGHGGTLDPLATGVLVTGVGKGTKQLNDFLGCTKTYEAVVVFGAETDSYDRVGKIVRRGPYAHVTREGVEKALAQFRGKIMQHPPIFSALKVKGKKLYEYAREGQLPPIEIQARPVEVSNLEILEWYEPGTHEHKWPEEEAPEEEKSVAEKLLAKDDALPVAVSAEEGQPEKQVLETSSATKRPAESQEEEKEQPTATTTEVTPDDSIPAPKKQKVSDDAAQDAPAEQPAATETTETTETSESKPESNETPQPPAVKITMTVSSGFYVRSLAHDLGKALGSCALMSELSRTRQADFTLDSDKILEYKDLDAGEEVWGPKVQGFLEEWEKKRERDTRAGSS